MVFFRFAPLLLLLSLPLSAVYSSAQTQGDPSEQFPTPIVRPYENLNIFEMSTMGSGDLGYRESPSTLSSPTKRMSNVELNKPVVREEKKTEEKAEEVEGGGSTPPVAEGVGAEEPTTQEGVSKTGPLYRWVDEKGVVHVTNNIAVVPLEEQLKKEMEEEKKAEDEQPSQGSNTP
jgi:hypothetical protein